MIEYTDEPICYFIHLHNNHNKITCANIEMKSHINEIDMFNKKIICKNQLIQLMQIKSEISAFKSEYIKNIYAIGNSSSYSCLAKYDKIPIRIKQILIKVEINRMLIEEFNVQIKEHNEQLNKCLEYYGISCDMVNYFKTNGYNIFDNDFLEYLKTLTNDETKSTTFRYDDFGIRKKIKSNYQDKTRKISYRYNNNEIKKQVKSNIHDMYIFKDFENCYDKKNEILKLHTYPLLFKDEKEIIITINYYYHQQNRINNRLSKFNGDIYGEIFKNFIKPKQVSNISLVCKMFYAMSKTKVILLFKSQTCKRCDIPIFKRTLLDQCNTCSQSEHIKCFKIIFKSTNLIIECFPLILQHFKSNDFIKLGLVCKSIYNIVKTFIVSIKPKKILCDNNKICGNSVCVIGKSLENKVLCGKCLKFKVLLSYNMPNKSWGCCCKCGSHYIVGKFYEKTKSKCQVCNK